MQIHTCKYNFNFLLHSGDKKIEFFKYLLTSILHLIIYIIQYQFYTFKSSYHACK